VIGVRHGTLAFVACGRWQFRFPPIKLQVQKVAVVMFVTEYSVPQNSPKKGLVGHDHVFNVSQVLMDHAAGSCFGQVFRKFVTNNEPLAAREHVNASYFLSEWG
jgi:hypothetical protein